MKSVFKKNQIINIYNYEENDFFGQLEIINT